MSSSLKCLTPIMVRNPNRGITDTHEFQFMRVPCGKCVGCIRRRALTWAFRLKQEAKDHPFASFITLTYDDDHLKDLNKDELQLFFKRMRKRTKIKYFACAEYGGLTKRPHYHMIMYGEHNEKQVRDCWTDNKKLPKGRIDFQPASYATMCYVAGYVNKKVATMVDPDQSVQKEFQLMSRGLGIGYLKNSIIDYHKTDLSRTYVTLEGGVKVAMPRYYKDKLYTPAERRIIRNLQQTEFVPVPNEIIETKTDRFKRKQRTKI